MYWLCILLLCWIHLLVLIVFFVWNLLGFSICEIMSSTEIILLLLFQFGCLISFSYLIALGRTPVLCTVEVVKAGILVLFLMLEEKFSVCHHWVWYLLWVFCIWLLLCWGSFLLLFLVFSMFFYHERALNFVRSVFSINWDDHVWPFFFLSVNVVYYIDFCMLNHPCILGINPTWSWGMILLICCWIWFASILLRIFASMFTRDICL